MPKYPCRICSKNVNNSNCICCDSCDQWIHKKCSGLSTFQFMQLSGDPSSSWLCGVCCDILPFGHLDDVSFKTTYFMQLTVIFAPDRFQISNHASQTSQQQCCDVCQAWLHINCAGLTCKKTLKSCQKMCQHLSTVKHAQEASFLLGN